MKSHVKTDHALRTGNLGSHVAPSPSISLPLQDRFLLTTPLLCGTSASLSLSLPSRWRSFFSIGGLDMGPGTVRVTHVPGAYEGREWWHPSQWFGALDLTEVEIPDLSFWRHWWSSWHEGEASSQHTASISVHAWSEGTAARHLWVSALALQVSHA